MAGHAGISLHLQIDPNFQARFQLAPAEGGEIETEAGGITVLFDVASAQRARGAAIDWVETMQGEGLSINLPEAPAPVRQMSVQELKEALDAGGLTLVDVRTDEEREKASIEGAQAMNADLMSQLEAMPKDTPLAFLWALGGLARMAVRGWRGRGRHVR